MWYVVVFCASVIVLHLFCHLKLCSACFVLILHVFGPFWIIFALFPSSLVFPCRHFAWFWALWTFLPFCRSIFMLIIVTRHHVWSFLIILCLFCDFKGVSCLICVSSRSFPSTFDHLEFAAVSSLFCHCRIVDLYNNPTHERVSAVFIIFWDKALQLFGSRGCASVTLLQTEEDTLMKL